MKEKISMIAFVIVLGTLLTGALTAVDNWTEPIIRKNEELKTKRSVLQALGIPFSPDSVVSVFQTNITEQTAGEATFYVNRDEDVAFRIAGSGLWGPITGVIALESDLATIKGITIIHQEETPGLGGRIGEKVFLDSFAGKTIVPSLSITKPGKARTDSEVDGITGATLSCNAFQRVVNSESAKYINLIKGTRKQ